MRTAGSAAGQESQRIWRPHKQRYHGKAGMGESVRARPKPQGNAQRLLRTSSIQPLDEGKPLRRLETDVVEEPKQLEILVRDNGLDPLDAQSVKI